MFTLNFMNGLPGTPKFTTFSLFDRNPVSRRRKRRRIWRPNPAMVLLHQRFIRYLRGLRVDLTYATGAVKNGSPRNNISRHRRNRFFYLTDLENAYQSVQIKKLFEVLCRLDPTINQDKRESRVFNEFLEHLFCSPRIGLYIGAPASPDLFNIYCAVLLDQKLGEFCRKHHLTYTRYLDDLTFSSRRCRIGKKKRKAIRSIIEEAGFMVSHKKSQVLDLIRGSIEICGIGLEFGGRIFLPGHFRRRVRATLHRAFTKHDVPKSQILGLWGIFHDVTSAWRLTRAEEKITKQFWQARKSVTP